jgi:flagellar hook-length control protein FliK
MPDLLAKLMVSAGSESGMSPAVVTVTDDKDLPSGRKDQDTQMLQNVAIWAAGMQLAQPQTDNGRMPGAGCDGGKETQDSQVGGIMDVNTVGMLKNTGSWADSSLIGKYAPGAAADGGALVGTPEQHTPESAPLEDGGKPMRPVSELPPPMQMAAVTPVETLPLKSAGVNPDADTSAGQVAVNPRSPLPVVPVVTGAGSIPELQSVSVKAESETSEQKIGGDETSTTPPDAGVARETAPKREAAAFRGGMGADVSPRDTNAATGRLTEVNAAVVPAVSETGAEHPQLADTGKLSPELHNAVSPNASAVSVALADNRQRADHVQENPHVATESGLKADLALQDTEGKGTPAEDSDSGSSGKKFAEFTPKSAETLTSVTQHVPGGHQTFSTESISSASLQPVQTETPRTDGNEQVARQVREQLASHDLKPGSDQITFKLSPDHLGDIKVNLRLDDQRLKVEIVAETRVARESLLQHVDSLKESLARQNISIDKFDVTTGGSSAGSQGNNANAQGELAKNRQSQRWLSAGGYRTPSADTVPLPQMYLAQTEHAMVDLHF